jgi:cytochrome c553
VATGRQIWADNCASCHGADGIDAEVGTPSLNAQQFLTAATDDQIYHVLASGVPGTDMPAWWVDFGGALTDEQIRAVIAYMRSWEGSAPDLPGWRDRRADRGRDGRHRVPAARVRGGRGPARHGAGRQPGHRGLLLRDRGAGPARTHPAGQVTTFEVTFDQEGEYGFECLGTGHGSVLGVGVIRAD